MERSDSSDDEPYGNEDFWAERGSFYEQNELLHEIARLQAELARRQELEVRSLRTLKEKTFRAITGFPSAGQAAEEFEKCGGHVFFDELQLVGRALDEELLDPVLTELCAVFPKHAVLIQGLREAAETKIAERN